MESCIKKFAMFYLDLDRFKPVNDTYGHDMGGQIAEGGFPEIVQMYQEDRLCLPYRWR